MAPVRLGDGTSIDKIRLGDGTEIAEIRKGDGTVLYSTNTVSYPFTIDDFERTAPLDDYNGDTGNFVVQTTNVKEGSKKLAGDDDGTGTAVHADDAVIYTSSIPNGTLPSRGDRVKYWFGFFGDHPSATSGAGSIQAVILCRQDSNNYYYAGAHNDNQIFVYKVKNGSVTKSDTASQNFDQDTWYEGIVDISSSTVDFTYSGNRVRIADSEWDAGGFGLVAGDIRTDSTDMGVEYDSIHAPGPAATDLTLVGSEANSNLAAPHDVVIGANQNYVYSAGKDTDSGNGTITAVDVSTPSSPTVVDTLTGYSEVQAVQIDATDATVLYAGDFGQLLTIDISSPTSMTETNAITVSGWSSSSGGPNGTVQSGTELFVAEKTGYYTRFDISTPSSPSIVTNHSVSHSAHDVALGNGALYGCDQANSSIFAYDEADITNQLDTFSDPSNLGGANRLQYHNNHLYVASNVDDTVSVYDVSDPSSMSQVAVVDTRSPEPSGMELDGANNLLYVGTSDHMQVYDISTPGNISERAYYNLNTSALIHDPSLPFNGHVAWPGQANDTLYVTDTP